MSARSILRVGFWILLLPNVSRSQTDEFEGNDDAGWTRLDPIGVATGGAFANFSVQSGLYRLHCDPTPDAALGPARVSSYRADQVYGDFLVVVDVVSWDNDLDQAIGLLARIQANPGSGAVNAYSLNYQPGDLDIEINRLENEVPVNLARVPLNLPPGDAYRFVFQGMGDQLQAAVFRLDDPLVPLTTLSAVDNAWEAGFCGLFAFNTDGTGAADAIFDSYSAGPGSAPVLQATRQDNNILLDWPRLTGAWHLESSPDLSTWADVTAFGAVSAGRLTFSAAIAGRRFYRLTQGWANPEPSVPAAAPDP